MTLLKLESDFLSVAEQKKKWSILAQKLIFKSAVLGEVQKQKKNLIFLLF